MKEGSVIIDIASSTGGNCELTEDGKTVVKHGVTIIGNSELAADVPNHASQLFSKNVHNFMKTFLKEGKAEIDLENEILKSSCIIIKGKLFTENKIEAMDAIMQFIIDNIEMLYILTFAIFLGHGGDF
jgi:NAD(P) transhydrogenase subunit alpha